MKAPAGPAEDRQKELLRRVRRIKIRTARLIRDFFAGQYHSAFKGRGMAFSEVREYIAGDDVRSIDWNVTARMNAPHVKQFVEERELTIMLMIDVSRSALFGSGDKSKRDHAAEIAAVMAFSAAQNNDRVGLILFTDRVEHYVPPEKGAGHVLRIIRDMLYCKPEGRLTDAGPALDFFNRVMKRRAVAFLISDFRCPPFKNSLALTARRHDLILAQVIDPLEERWPRIGLMEFEDLESGERVLFDTGSKRSGETLAAEHQASQDRLGRMVTALGLDFLVFHTNRSVVDPLRRFFRSRRRRRR